MSPTAVWSARSSTDSCSDQRLAATALLLVDGAGDWMSLRPVRVHTCARVSCSVTVHVHVANRRPQKISLLTFYLVRWQVVPPLTRKQWAAFTIPSMRTAQLVRKMSDAKKKTSTGL
jgi:hypothetical protein